jgi:NADP-reducing hydrogenase subunit HndC
MYRSHVLICGGTGCTSSNSEKIIAAMEGELKKNGLEQEVKVVKTGCFGLCALGPSWWFTRGRFYSMVKVEDTRRIVSEHLLKGRIVKSAALFRNGRERNGQVPEDPRVL